MIFICCHVVQPIQMKIQDFMEGSPTHERNPAGIAWKVSPKILNFIWTCQSRIMQHNLHTLWCYAAISDEDSGFQGRKPWLSCLIFILFQLVWHITSLKEDDGKGGWCGASGRKACQNTTHFQPGCGRSAVAISNDAYTGFGGGRGGWGGDAWGWKEGAVEQSLECQLLHIVCNHAIHDELRALQSVSSTDCNAGRQASPWNSI